MYNTVDIAIDLHRAMLCLTNKQREVFMLVMDGYTQREAAAMLGVSRRSVRDRLARAIATMQRSAGAV